MAERKYFPTVAQLIDRLCIVTLKSIKISSNKEAYEAEADLIMHDLDLLEGPDSGRMIRAIQVNAIANESIWANESKAREGGADQNDRLLFTHSINGVRTAAMNEISDIVGERKDLKADCVAADLCTLNGYDFRGVI